MIQCACYPDQLREEWADQIFLTKTCAPDPLGEFVDESSDRAGALENIAYNGILQPAAWATIMMEACGDRTGRRIHINTKEIRGSLRTARR